MSFLAAWTRALMALVMVFHLQYSWADSVPLTRGLAQKQALEHSPLMGEARQGLAGALARRKQADGFEAPSVYWEFEEARNASPSRFGSQSLGVEQSFNWFGVSRARKSVADLGINAATLAVSRTRLRLQAKVNKAFDRVLLAEKIKGLISRMLQRTSEAVAISRVRFKSGTGSYIDLLRTRVANQRLRNDLRDAERERLAARRQLGVLLGNDIGTTRLHGQLEFEGWSEDAQSYITQARREGPSFLLYERLTQQSKQRFEAVRKARYPEVTVGIGRQRLFNGTTTDYAWSGQLSLKLPIPGSDRQRGNEGEAYAEFHSREARARQFVLQANARLQQQVDAVRALAAQLEDYRSSVLPDVEDQRKAAVQQYRVRRIDALNLLDIYTTYIETRRQHLETLTRYRAVIADLKTFGEDLWEIE